MTQIVAVPRYKNEFGVHTDLFAVGDNGNIYTSSYKTRSMKYSHVGMDWQSLGHPNGLPFPERSNIAAVSRRYNNLDVFAIGGDGTCYRTTFTAASGWTSNGSGDNWTTFAGGGRLSPGTPIVAISRNPDHIDVMAIGDGEVKGAWTHGESSVGEWYSLGRPVGSPPLTERCKIDAVAVGERDHLVVICGEREGDVWARRWNGNQQPWTRLTTRNLSNNGQIPISVAPPASPLSAVKSSYGECDVFAVFNHGEVFVSWTSEGAWQPFDAQGGKLQPGSPVTAVLERGNVDGNTLRLFGITTDFTVVTTTTNPRTRTSPPPWTEIGAKGLFPAGTKLAVVTANPGEHYVYGVTNEGTVLAAKVVNGKATSWTTIGGQGSVKLCNANSGIRPITFAQLGSIPSVQAEVLIDSDRELKISGSGFAPYKPYLVILRYRGSVNIQHEYSGASFVIDRGGRLECRLSALKFTSSVTGNTPVPSKVGYALEIKILCEGGQSANTFVLVPKE
ncbi:hypothetical protein CspHIS471_0601360 [Cutaneotrichosporon sp. HIS471]|nr:hypothetical protein CspHIS471_0601360 [Cutaneotrichosporon sp. HIS471]